MDKPIVLQQYFKKQINNGGPATGAKLLIDSFLKDRFEFVEMDELRPSFLNYKQFLYFYNTIKHVNPDLVHIRGVHLEGFWGVLAAKLLRKKVVLSVHGLYIDANISKFQRLIFGKIIEPLALLLADCVYCVCDFAARRPYIANNAKHLYGHIYNAAPAYPEVSLTEKENCKTLFGFKKDDIVISLVGRVTTDKGFAVLENAIDSILSKNNVKLLVAGEGPYLDHFSSFCQKWVDNGQVVLLGKTNKIREVLSASDIFLFPTLHENLSNALLEACSAGLAIAATNVGGNPEVIQDSVTGLLFGANDVSQLVNAVQRLVDNKEERITFGANARKRVEDVFSQKKIFTQIGDLYQSLINS